MLKNNKGFVLVETLVVSVAIAAIFSVIYVNIVPVLGEYEKLEQYNDLDTTYVAHWMRMLIIKQGKRNLATLLNSATATSPKVVRVEGTLKSGEMSLNTFCSTTYFTNPTTCKNFFNQFNIKKLYITPYTLTDFKTYAKNNYADNPGFQEYVLNLPDYSKGSTTYSKRILIEVEHNEGLDQSDDYYTSYATAEVNKDVYNFLYNQNRQ